MNNINTFDAVNNGKKSSSWKNLWYALMMVALFNSNSPAEAKTNDAMDIHSQNIELVESPVDIIWNLEKSTWIKFPPEYRGAFQEFVNKYKILQDKDVLEFTEKFVAEEIKKDIWVKDKSDQILFLITTVLEELTGDYLYYWDDGNDNRFEEYSDVMDKLEDVKQRFGNWLDAHLKKLSAEAKQQSAEAKQQSAEAKQQSAEAKEKTEQTVNAIFDEIISCYNLCKTPSDFKKFESFKSNVENAISISKHFGFDYKTIILEKLWGDENKLHDFFEKLGIKEWDENDFTDAWYDKRIYNILDHYRIVEDSETESA